MFAHQEIATTPLFLLFVSFSCLLSVFFYWGRRRNRKIFLSAFSDLVNIVRPDDQTFTNIGGMVGHHATLQIEDMKKPFSQVEATITLLPRHSLLYLPVSLTIMRFDRLFITLHQRHHLSGEGHLIEKRYAGFRGPKITNAHQMEKIEIRWGSYDFLLYFEKAPLRDRFMSYVRKNPDPGTIRHIAFVAGQKKCFIFMIPRLESVRDNLKPVYRWLCEVSR
ncbi:MAG: hypothetical protein CSA26_06465 [Desulfobacterales bacterium]|nr:MAG: hypothetical protein CSA26_06465 [Desulfobacterales bacterium]